jgi:hypothetical protein
MQYFPNGTQYAVSSALAAAIAISAISNADPGVATTATVPTDGDILLLSSGWSALNDTVVRVDGADVGDFELEDIDTTSTTRFPAGEGAGTYQKVSTWEPLSQINDVALSGGEQQFYEFQYVEDREGRVRRKPTTRSARALEFMLDHDPDLDWYATLSAADAAGELVVLRAILPSGDTLYYLGYPSFDKQPTQTKNVNMQNKFILSMVCEPKRYAAA